jgi:putative DNA primase/helicase
LFTTNQLPYDYDPNAKCELWNQFQTSIWDDDEDKKALLQEIGGYLLTDDARFEKFVLLQGKSRGGKGTIVNTLEGVLGKRNCTSIGLKRFNSHFALSKARGKKMIMVNEADMPKGREGIGALNSLLEIVGHDTVDIDIKFDPDMASEKITGLIIVSTTDPLDIDNPSGSIMNRLLCLDFVKSFADCEDFDLKDKLLQELPGIFNWCLEGYHRLYTNYRFTAPESSKEMAAEMALNASPVRVFVDECCVVDPNAQVTKSDLLAAYEEWNDYAVGTYSEVELSKRLRIAYPTITATQRPYINGKRQRVYTGIRLKTRKELLMSNTNSTPITV